MIFSATSNGSIGPLPCGFMSCETAVGLLAGTDRDEKRALRAAEAAERRFRAEHGYDRDTLAYRVKAMLHVKD